MPPSSQARTKKDGTVDVTGGFRLSEKEACFPVLRLDGLVGFAADGQKGQRGRKGREVAGLMSGNGREAWRACAVVTSLSFPEWRRPQ